MLFFTMGNFNPSPNPQAGGSPHIGGPRLLIQCVCNYLTYLEAVSSNCNLRLRRAMPW
jgi:hypothetical protein